MKTDTQITNEILNEFDKHQLGLCKIKIAVTNGFVTLSGTVDSYTKKILAERTVKNLEDIKGLSNDIDVVLTTAKRSEAKLAKSLLIGAMWRIRN